MPKTYTRKTRDLWDILGYYADGWEVVTTETDWKTARDSLKAYRVNEPGTRFKMRKYREAIDPNEQPVS